MQKIRISLTWIVLQTMFWIRIRMEDVDTERISRRQKTGIWSKNQCFGSIFIESGSSKKSQSGSRKALNPDPDPSYFFTLSEKKVFIIKRSQLKDRML